MIELALEVAHDLVPFTHGDSVGKSAEAIAHAKTELAKLDPESVRAKLYELQVLGGELPEVEMPLQHVYAPGLYARTIFIPAGTFVVGKIHKHRHVNTLSMGMVDVLTESGGVERLCGPMTMTSEPGTKRALYAHTDLVWTTYHVLPRDNMTLDEIEDYVIAPTYEAYERFLLEGEHHAIDLQRAD